MTINNIVIHVLTVNFFYFFYFFSWNTLVIFFFLNELCPGEIRARPGGYDIHGRKVKRTTPGKETRTFSFDPNSMETPMGGWGGGGGHRATQQQPKQPTQRTPGGGGGHGTPSQRQKCVQFLKL